MPAARPLLSRKPARALPGIPLLPGAKDHLPLVKGRIHEACGPARHTLALWLAAQTDGPVFWISPSWGRDRLNPCGVMPMLDPARLIFVDARRPEDLLWSMEEVLRSGAVPLAVADLPGLPGLTPVRRMHLAAEAGGGTGAHLPLGLLLTPGNGGAQGVETRWRLTPDHRGAPARWRLDRLRARTAPRLAWQVEHRPGAALPRLGAPLAPED